MNKLKSALRTLLVICTLAFTAAAQGSGLTMVGGRDGTAAGGGAALGGGGIIGGELNTMGNPPMQSDIAGGSQPREALSPDLWLSLIISLLTNVCH